MRSVALTCVIATLSGCSIGARDHVFDVGAEVFDEAAATAENVMCRGISVGAWTRRFGRSHEQARAWKTLCGHAGETPKR